MIYKPFMNPFWMFSPFTIIRILKKIQEPERKSAGESKARLDAYANNSRMAATSGAIKSAKNTVERFKEGVNDPTIKTIFEKYKVEKILNVVNHLTPEPILQIAGKVIPKAGTIVKKGFQIYGGMLNTIVTRDGRRDLAKIITSSEGRREIVKITKSELCKIGDKIDKKIDSFVDKGQKVVKSFSDNIKPVIDTIKDKTSKTLDYISSGVDTAWSKAKDVASKTWSGVKEKIGSFIGRISLFGF